MMHELFKQEPSLEKWVKARKIPLDRIPSSEWDTLGYRLNDAKRDCGSDFGAEVARDSWWTQWSEERPKTGQNCLVYVCGNPHKYCLRGYTMDEIAAWEHFVMDAAWNNGASSCCVEWSVNHTNRLVCAYFQSGHNYTTGKYVESKVKVPGDVDAFRLEVQPKHIVKSWGLHWAREMDRIMDRQDIIKELGNRLQALS